ncbi:SAM domain-containing protein [Citrus sinensis]|uniref:SAM domain-containing protein n=1 Tax=Citrus sinensis TaxID=2711 RepID=A0ACB8MH68_CITSI|nr:SAM domain-containing protein [Citrus sinensis]
MYADRVEAAAKQSVKERLNGNSVGDSTRRRSITGKRQRQDDKWEHDLYTDDEPNASNRIVGVRDLRLKLQKKSLQQVSQSGKGHLSGVRDLREKLSGTMNSQPVNSDPPKPKLEAAKLARKSVAVEAPEPESKRVAAETSVDGFLRSLGLEKYSITFQAEEVDMTALLHMTDEDLKALGIPMIFLFILLVSGPEKEDTLGIGIQSLTSQAVASSYACWHGF